MTSLRLFFWAFPAGDGSFPFIYMDIFYENSFIRGELVTDNIIRSIKCIGICMEGGRNLNDEDLNSSAFLNVLVALILFYETNQDILIPVKLIKSLLQHYNILK
jgi:hypothetical protein